MSQDEVEKVKEQMLKVVELLNEIQKIMPNVKKISFLGVAESDSRGQGVIFLGDMTPSETISILDQIPNDAFVKAMGATEEVH